jgi:hypothetical protein
MMKYKANVTQNCDCVDNGRSISDKVPTIYTEVNVKVKLSLCLTKRHTMKVYLGSGGIAPLIL